MLYVALALSVLSWTGEFRNFERLPFGFSILAAWLATGLALSVYAVLAVAEVIEPVAAPLPDTSADTVEPVRRRSFAPPSVTSRDLGSIAPLAAIKTINACSCAFLPFLFTILRTISITHRKCSSERVTRRFPKTGGAGVE